MDHLLRNLKKQRTRLFDKYKIRCEAYKDLGCKNACERNEFVQYELNLEVSGFFDIKCGIIIAAQNDKATIRLYKYPFSPKPTENRNTLLWWLQEIDISSIHLIFVPKEVWEGRPSGTPWTEEQMLETHGQFQELFPRATISTAAEGQ